MTVIREYQFSDQSDVVQLWHDCELIRPPSDPVIDIELKIRHDPGLFVAIDDSQIIGTVMAGYDGHRGWINYLAVSQRYRRSGLGTRLLQRGEEYLAGAGCEKINLQVRRANLDVVSFYSRAGYVADDVVSLGKRLA